MCHSSLHMLICGGWRGSEQEEHDTDQREGGFFSGFLSWAFLVWLSEPICLSAYERVMSFQASFLLLSSFRAPWRHPRHHQCSSKCCTWYASRPLDADSDGLGWNVCVWYLTRAAAYHVGGLQTNVFETVLCLQIWADLISLWQQRLEEDLARGEKTVQKCLIMFGMHSEGTGTCDLASFQEKLFWRPNAFKGKTGSNHLTVPYPQGNSCIN